MSALAFEQPVVAASVEGLPRTCFICGCDSGEAVARHEFDVCGLGRIAYGLRCCDGCGLVLQDPVVPPEVMARQYALFSNYTAFEAGDPPLGASAARMLAMVRRAGLARGSVYDVGAATGAMLWWFRREGWSVGGCDPSPAALAQAQGRNQIDLDLGTGEEALPGRRGLDLVTLSHVIEHIYDPVAALGAVRAALADSGHVLLEAPCLTAPALNPPGLFAVEHINYFDPTSLSNLLGLAGFAVVEMATTLDHFPFPVVTALARKAEPNPAIVQGYADSHGFCRTYLELERARWAAVDERIRRAIAPGEPVCIWGAGVHTSMLLSRTSLVSHARIAAITDRDPQKHGQALAGLTVTEPARALERGLKIVVSSYVSEAAIARSLIEQGVDEGRLVRLYT